MKWLLFFLPLLTLKEVLYSVGVIFGNFCFLSGELDRDLFVSSYFPAQVKVFGDERLLQHTFHHELCIFDTENAIE